MRRLDDIDEQLLRELRRNARASHAMLGIVVRLSSNAVRQRVERLERDGHIEGYTIREAITVGPGADAAVATLLVQRHDRMRGDDVVASLEAIPEVRRCDVVAGELDLVVHVEAANTTRVSEIWRLVAGHPGVKDITTAVTLSVVIDRSRA